MIYRKSNQGYKHLLRVSSALLLSMAFLFSCTKQKIDPVEIYPEGPLPLVQFLEGNPSPTQGAEGSDVTYNIKGLKGKEGQFKFYINQTESEIVTVAENTITVKVPADASTGGASVLINGEYYFGPTFTVRGKVSIDPNFNPSANKSTGPIFGIFPEVGTANFVIYGGFTNYQDKNSRLEPITGMAIINPQGIFVERIVKGKGINGSVTSVVPVDNGNYYYIAGSFNAYDTITNINNIARTWYDGTLETMTVDIVNPDPINHPENNMAEVPALNGGTIGGITKVFNNDGDRKITVIGNMRGHVNTFYERSAKGAPYLDNTDIRQVIRMNWDGSLDTTFNYNTATKKGYAGANGFILDALKTDGGDIIVVGGFTTYNGKTVNNISRIRELDGLVAPDFNLGGAGANGTISGITYNESTGKILLTGSFTSYNGVPADGVVMIDENGARDASFNFRAIEGGFVNYAGQLNNGKIIVSGSFNKYNNIVRPGMVILNADGTLASGYNNMGLFQGQINSMVEYTTTTGIPAVTLVGSFNRFDNKQVGNIVQIRIEN